MTSPAGAGLEDPLKSLIPRKGAMWRTFALPETRVMYVQINKNACTSLKWMMAGLAGEDLDGFPPSLRAGTSEHDEIHDRRAWKKVPRLDAMTPQQRAQIHPDNGWFVFAVIRDPRSRLFSAWQNKLLLENPGYTGYRIEPWYPRHPLDTDTVVEDFAQFVALFEREPEHRIRAEGHFRDQVEMLHEDAVTYTKVYDIRELGTLFTDLQQHLKSVGWAGSLQLPKINDTPLRVNALPFGNGIRERIEKIYAGDFEQFGDRWDYGHIERQPDWTVEELREAEWRATYGRRMSYLRSQALKFSAEAKTERARADAARAQTDKLRAQVRALKAGSAPVAQPRRNLRQLAGAVRRRLRLRWLS
jgi:hypothetical protein